MGGFKYIVGLNAFNLSSEFKPNNSPFGNPMAEPSYPQKQYINQDLNLPWNSDFKTSEGVNYDSYNFTSNTKPATYYNLQGVTSDGYRVPRKLLNVVLDGVNKLIITADYSQPDFETSDKLGGIAFANVLADVSQTQIVDGYFPRGWTYVPNTTYIWSIDYVNLTTGFALADTSTYIVTHAACGNQGVEDPENYYVFIAAASSLNDNVIMSPLDPNTPVANLASNTSVKVSGGICAVGPFLFAYGNNGLIRNSDINNPLKWADPSSEAWQQNPGLANDVNVCNSKIVKGVSYRGTGTYAALFWSLDSLIMANYVGAPAVFSYSILATNISIIAPNSVVERSGDFFWLGDGRFFTFSGGQVQEVKNEYNRDWFFSSIDKDYQYLSWGCLNPEFSEIWWFFPFKGSKECNYAIIFNYQDGVWYDTPIDRSAGIYSSVSQQPIWATPIPDSSDTATYDIYLHEEGLNNVNKNGVATPIFSSFTTPVIGYTSSQNIAAEKTSSGLINNWTSMFSLEPDAIISSDWVLETRVRRFANSPVTSDDINIYGFNSNTEKIDIKTQGRLIQFEVYNQSNDADFYLGDFMLTASPGDNEGI
jgi:hypothetical protein